MRSEITGTVALDLLSIPALVFRLLRRKLVKSTLADADPELRILHFEILHVLKKEGGLHVAEIGDRLQVAKAQMTHLLDTLVEMGLVERQMNATDRRTMNISLTSLGRAALQEHENCLINSVRENMSSLSDEELVRLSVSLRNVRDTLLKLQ
jgi:DNA-binding MarR family transcriptional regulator